MAADGSVVIEITGNADDFESALKEIIQSAQKLSALLGGVGDSATDSFTELASAGDKLGDSMSSAKEKLADLSNTADSTGDGLDELSQSAKESGDGLEDVSESAEDAGDNLGELSGTAQDSVAGIEGISDSANNAGSELSGLSDSAQASGAGLDEISDSAENAETGIEGLEDSAQKSGDGLEGLGDSAEKTSKSMEDISEEAETQKNKIAVLEAQYEAAKQRVEELTKAFNDSAEKNGAASDETQRLAQELQSAENAAASAKSKLDDVSNSAKNAGNSFGSFDSMFQASFLANLAEKAISAVVDALKNMVSAIMDAGTNFTSSMSQVAATMGMTVEEIHGGSEAYKTLEAAAKEAGSTTAYSASEAADALNYLALAGYDAEQAADALPAVLNLAAAGNLDLAYASDLATDAMSALGIEASNKNLTQFGDQMAKTASKANTSVAQLGEAILTVGGTAKDLSGGTVELNTALGVLANRGYKGSEAGTHLRNVILKLTTAEGSAKKALDKLIGSAYDADGNMRSLNDIFKDMNASLSEMSTSERANALATIFNTTDLASVQALLAGCGDEFENLALAIENSGGAMQAMADTQLDNLSGDLQMLGSATEGLYLNIYSALEPALRSLTQAATAVVSWVSDLVEKAPWLVTMVAGAATAVGALAVAMGVYTAATKMATAVVAAFGLANKAALGPIALVAGAIGGVIGLVAGLSAAQSKAYKEMRAETDALIKENDALVESVKETRDAYEESVSSMSGERDNTVAMSAALDELINKENQTAADKAAILELVDQLNEAVPSLNLAYDEQTNSLTDLSTQLPITTDDILAAAEAQYAMQQAQAEAARYAEINAKKQLLLSQIKENEARIDEKIAEKQAEAAKGWSANIDVMHTLGTEIEDLRASNEDLNEQIDLLDQEMEDARENVDAYTKSLEETEEATDGAREKLAELTASMDKLEAAYAEAYEAAKESVEGQYALWEEADEVTAKSVESINKSIQSQIEHWSSYNDNLEFLKTRVGDFEGLGEVIANFSDGSVESMGAVQGIVDALNQGNYEAVQQMIEDYNTLKETQSSVEENMADAETGYSETSEKLQKDIEEATEKANKDLENHADSTKESMEDATNAVNAYDDFYTAGQNDVQGLIDGASDMTSQVNSTFYAIGQAALSAYKLAMDQHSPSKKMFEAGVNDLLGLINGANSKKSDLVETYTEMAEAVQDELDDYLNDSEHQIFLWGKQGGQEGKIIAQYQDMMDQLHTMAETYRAMGLDENSDEIQALQKQWWGYSDNIKDIQETMYKNRLSELQKSLEREEITQERYLELLIAAQKEYLTEGADAWNAALEDQEEAVNAMLDTVKSLESDYDTAMGNVKSVISEHLNNIKTEYESALNALEAAQESMRSKLAATGDLFTTVKDSVTGTTTFELMDLQAQIDEINAYGDALEGLKARGISESLMQEVLGMSTTDAQNYADALLSMTDDQFSDYLDLWEEKQTAASEIAERFYSDDIQTLQDEYADAMVSVIAELPEEFRPLGEEAMEELSEGLQEKGEEAVAVVRDIKEQIKAELSEIMSIADLSDSLRAAVQSETARISSNLNVSVNAAAEAENIKAGKQAAQIADTMALANSATNYSKEVTLEVNGIEFGRAIIPDLRAVEDQSPRIVSD